MARAIPVLMVLSLGACTDDAGVVASEAITGACPSISVEVFLPAVVRSAPLQVEGVAGDGDEMTIESILVASRSATSGSFNFATWSVTLDAATLIALPRADGDDRFVVPIRAIDHHGAMCEPEGSRPEVIVRLESPDAAPSPDGNAEIDSGPASAERPHGWVR
jgi:hypothetical protein